MKVNESGRSMIEMLGVLAIIGVLSVGGIAGYTKAMTQYKINKTIDQVTHVVGNIRTLYFSQKDYSTVTCDPGLTSGNCPILRKGHVIPEDMWKNSTGPSIENPFGGYLVIHAASKKSSDSNDHKAFVVSLSGLPEEACMALATYDWGSGSSSGLIAVAAGTGSPQAYSEMNGNGPYALADPAKCGRLANPLIVCPKSMIYPAYTVPMPADFAASACSSTSDDNMVQLKFY